MSHELNLNQAATHKIVGFPAKILFCLVLILYAELF